MHNKMQDRKVQIECSVWNHENNGLFDYEAKDLKSQVFEITRSHSLLLKDNIIEVCEMEHEGQIGRIEFLPSDVVFRPNPKYGDAYLKLGQNKKHKLQAGDLFKLGRIEYYVSEMYTEEDEHIFAEDRFKLDRHIEQDSTPDKQCRFCFMENNESQNPLISGLCKCRGHSQCIHFECLQEWVKKKFTVKETPNTVQYEQIKILECEVCKETLPGRVYIAGNPNAFNLIHIERLELPYLLLEQLNKQIHHGRLLTLIHSANQAIVHVGRGHNCEVRSQDISVSRSHACIEHTQQGWMIWDLGSKFGTLQAICDKQVLGHDLKEIQIGKILIKIKVES